MNQDDLYYPMLIVWIIQITGMLCLLLAIPTFLISKVLRTHPGSLILMCCIVEFFYYYMGFLLMSATLYNFHKIDFDIFGILVPTIHTLTFGIIQLNPNGLQLYIFLTAVAGTSVLILDAYNICLSLDIILIIRNPFYSPSRRVYLYHFCSLIFPLTIIFPISLFMSIGYPFETGAKIPSKTRYLGIIIVLIGLLMAASLVITSSGALIFSFHKIKKLVLKSKQKRMLLWKIVIYQIFALIYSTCLLVLNISIVILTINLTEGKEYELYIIAFSVRVFIRIVKFSWDRIWL